MRHFLFLFLLFTCHLVTAKKTLEDHENIWKDKSNSDSLRMESLGRVAWQNSSNQPEIAVQNATDLLIFAREKNDSSFQWKAMNAMSAAYSAMDSIKLAVQWHDRALKIVTSMQDSIGIGVLYSNMGSLSERQGNYAQALQFYLKSLEIRTAVNHKLGISASLRKIGNIYQLQKNYAQALSYYEQALELSLKLGEYNRIIIIYNKKASIFRALKEYEKSNYWHGRAEKLHDKASNLRTAVETYQGLGKNAIATENYPMALDYFIQANEINIATDNKSGLASAYINIAHVKQLQGKLLEALDFALKAMTIAENAQHVGLLRNCSFRLFEIYELLGNSKNALAHYKSYTNLKDSLASKANSTAVKRTQLRYELEKTMISDSLERLQESRIAEEEAALFQAQIDSKNRIQISGTILLVLLMLMMIGLSRKLNIKPKVASGLIFMFFILLFEFVLVVLDPWVEEWSSGQIGIKLSINTLFAVILFLGHQFFEGRLKKALMK